MKESLAFKKNKKGNLTDIVHIMGGAFALALTIIIATMTYTQFSTEFNNMTDVPDEAKDVVNSFGTKINAFQSAFVFLIVGLTIVLCISAVYMPSTPALIFVNVIGLFILVLIAGIYSYIYRELVISDTLLFNAAASTPILSHIMSNFHYYCCGIVIIVTIIAYGKYKMVNQ